MAGKIHYIKRLENEPCGYWQRDDDARLSAHFALTGVSPQSSAASIPTVKIQTLLQPARLEGVKKGFLGASFSVLSPACPTCNACVPLRVNTDKFMLSASQKKLLADGQLSYRFQETISLNPAELFHVFKSYVTTRHSNDESQMNKWNIHTFKNWLGFMPYTLTARDQDNCLVGFSSYEAKGNTAIMEYAAYTPEVRHLSVGKRLWLEAVRQSQESGIKHVYVGPWAKGSPKLGYKADHRGLETYVFNEKTGKGRWVDFDPDVHTTGPNYNAMLRAEGFDI